MAIVDKLNALEAAVKDGQEKQVKLSDANAAASIAQKNYDESVAKINRLKAELQDVISDIFPSQNPRVRIA